MRQDHCWAETVQLKRVKLPVWVCTLTSFAVALTVTEFVVCSALAQWHGM